MMTPGRSLDTVTPDVVIVGAGMAGLTCAVKLKELGVHALVLDAADEPGGKIRSDEHEGFLLDRGFQVLLTAYPETRRLLDIKALGLKAFHSGALVRHQGRFTRLGDPTRHPGDLLPTALSSVGTLWDKASILRLRLRVCGPPLDRVLSRPETTTAERLRELGFSRVMIQSFFRPFLGGIFLETELATSSRKFEFVFRMFSQGVAALPSGGMRDIPRQLAARLAPDRVRLGQQVTQLTGSAVHLASGETITARQIVIATDLWTASQLLQREATATAATVVCLYFDAQASPVRGHWLVLNGEGSGPINNLSVPSDLQPAYATAGRSLVSVTVLDPGFLRRGDVERCVRAQLSEWYGPQTHEWRHLRTYRIPYAVTIQAPPALTPVAKPLRVTPSVVQCGDYTGIVSIEGAVQAGTRAAEEVFRALS